MPGIVGIVTRDKRAAVIRDLDAMIGSMLHEPFYTHGKYVCEELGLYVGWVARQDSFSDCTPLSSNKKDIVLIFSGEDFSADRDMFRNGARHHESNPRHVKSRQHGAEPLLRRYESEGDGFLRTLNGWFGGIVIDHRKKRAVLFNDRYGMHRLYHHQGQDELLFASEAKALLRVRPGLRHMDYTGLGQYFSCDCVLENRTLFRGVSLLPAGSAWEINNGGTVKKRTYFDRTEWEEAPALEPGEFLERFVETFRNILPRYLVPRDQVGIALTSGLDTRMIMAWLCTTNGSFTSHTFTGMNGPTLDAALSWKIAQTCGINHKIIPIDHDFVAEFPRLAGKTVYVSDGCHDVQGSHDVYYNEIARGWAPVRMTGKFGSEIVRSNSLLTKPLRLWNGLFEKDFLPRIEAGEEALSRSRKCNPLTFAAFKEVPWHEFGRLAVEQSKLTLRTPYMNNDIVELMYRAPRGLRASDDIPLHVVGEGNKALMNIVTDRGQGGAANRIITWFRRAGRYAQFKTEYLYLFQLPPALVRLDALLDPLHFDRRFFSRYQLLHYGKLFRNELSGYIRDILTDRETLTRPYLYKDTVKHLVEGHLRGRQNFYNEINKLLTVELVHRQFNIG